MEHQREPLLVLRVYRSEAWSPSETPLYDTESWSVWRIKERPAPRGTEDQCGCREEKEENPTPEREARNIPNSAPVGVSYL